MDIHRHRHRHTHIDIQTYMHRHTDIHAYNCEHTGETAVFGEVSDEKYKYSLFLDPRDKLVQVTFVRV